METSSETKGRVLIFIFTKRNIYMTTKQSLLQVRPRRQRRRRPRVRKGAWRASLWQRSAWERRSARRGRICSRLCSGRTPWRPAATCASPAARKCCAGPAKPRCFQNTYPILSADCIGSGGGVRQPVTESCPRAHGGPRLGSFVGACAWLPVLNMCISFFFFSRSFLF
jgi:hypothetical protein